MIHWDGAIGNGRRALWEDADTRGNHHNQPRRTTGYAKRKQASRRQEETGTVYTLHQQQPEGANVLEVGPLAANRSPSGTGQPDRDSDASAGSAGGAARWG